MTKKEIMKHFGLHKEAFNFYVQMGHIKKTKGKSDEWTYDPRMETWLLDKSSVYKYCFNDYYWRDVMEFKKVIENTGPCKVYTKEEIAEYVRKQEEQKKNPKK